ncbi:MAG: sulfatase [Planctomycetota bacterium]
MARPNIIVILCDDLGWADLSCYGSTFHETPRLDQMAAEGMRCTDAYAASPVCSPTRASLLSGQYPARVGITNYIPGNAAGRVLGPAFRHDLPHDLPTLPSLLRDAGYRTLHVGKWHLGEADKGHAPTDHGFDVNVGGCAWGHPRKGFFSPYELPAEANLPDGPDGEYLTDRITDEAINLVRDAAGRDEPFFLHLAHYAVHTPIQAPADLVEKYEQKARDLGLDTRDPFEPGEPHPCLHKLDQPVMRRLFQSDPTYAAMVENLDTNVGRLLDALVDLGIDDGTLVLFTSDNGGLATSEGSPTCNAPLSEGKGWSSEGGLREPFIARWPARIASGQTSDATLTTPDLLPTFLAAADVEVPDEVVLDGESCLSLLTSGAQSSLDDRPIYFHYPHYSNQGGGPASAVRRGRWKLVEHLDNHTGYELYDLEADIGETTNLAEREPERVAELQALIDTWRDEVDAAMPTPNPHYDAILQGRARANGSGKITFVDDD